MTSLSSSSSGESTVPSKQRVQFGIKPIPDRLSQYSNDENESSDSSFVDNVNERLRHAVPVIERGLQVKRLNELETSLCTVVVQKSHQEVSILRCVSGGEEHHANLEYVPLDEKYHNAEYDMELVIHPEESFLITNKFKKDISWIETILWAVIKNLQRDHYYDDLIKILEDDELTKQEEKMLLGAKEFNKKEIQKLKCYMDIEKKKWTKAIQEVTEQMGNCKDQLNDDMTEFVVAFNYIKQWEKSRNEQNKRLLEKQEKQLLETKKMMEMEKEKEERVHDELWLFLENSLEDYKKGIEMWMDKYDKDYEEKEKQVAKGRINLYVQKDQHQELLKEYNRRQVEMEEYKEHKLQKQKEVAEMERRNKAATRIQAWWRGVMFRKGLGPFRRKKGKGKKGGSGHDSAKKKK